MQHVEQLPLVLMQALDLDVKNGVGVQQHPRLPGHIGGKAALVLPFDLLQALEDRLVVTIFL